MSVLYTSGGAGLGRAENNPSISMYGGWIEFL